MLRERGLQGAGRFHRGPARDEIDPSARAARSFIDLNNLALSRFTDKTGSASASTPALAAIATRPTVPTAITRSCCPACSTSRPQFLHRAGGREQPPAGIEDHPAYMKPGQRVFVGVVSPIDPKIDTAEEVRDRVLQAVNTFPSSNWGRPTTAGSHRSATTRPRPGTRPSRRSRARSRHRPRVCGAGAG